MLLKGAGLDKIVDPDGMLLAEAMEPPDALVDLHRVPRQIEIHEAMAELEIASLRAAVGQNQGAPALAKILGDRLALGRRSRAVHDEHLDPSGAQSFGERGLSVEELSEEDQ